MSDIIIGIDLGTTNSEVAVVRGRTGPDSSRSTASKILPSVVGLADDGALLVGQSARNQYVLHPSARSARSSAAWAKTPRLELGDKAYSPQEISALILRRLKQAAEAHLGEPVSKAVITVPAYFSDAQRQATRDAGELAGLEVVRIINEPTAAALAYEVDHQEPKNILVYDLGGGTFDVSVVRMDQDVTEVLASHGNNQLGGDDFDAKLVEHLVDPSAGEQPASTRATIAAPWRASARLRDGEDRAQRRPLRPDRRGVPAGARRQAGQPVPGARPTGLRGDDRALYRRDPGRGAHRAEGRRAGHLGPQRGPAGRRRHPHALDPAASRRAAGHAAAQRGRPGPVRGDRCGDTGRGDRRRSRSRRCWWTSPPTPSAPARWAS